MPVEEHMDIPDQELIIRCTHCCFLAHWESISHKHERCPMCRSDVVIQLEEWRNGQWSGDEEGDLCECGHWLQLLGGSLRCVMGCAYQTERDAR